MKKSMNNHHKTQNDHKCQVAHNHIQQFHGLFCTPKPLNKWKEEDRMLEPLIGQSCSQIRLTWKRFMVMGHHDVGFCRFVQFVAMSILQQPTSKQLDVWTSLKLGLSVSMYVTTVKTKIWDKSKVEDWQEKQTHLFRVKFLITLLSFRFQKLSNNVRIDKSMDAFDKSDTFFPHTHRDHQSGVWIVKWYIFEGEARAVPLPWQLC